MHSPNCPEGGFCRTPISKYTSKSSYDGLCRTPNFVERRRQKLANAEARKKERRNARNKENKCAMATSEHKIVSVEWKPQALTARQFDEALQGISADPCLAVYIPVAAK